MISKNLVFIGDSLTFGYGVRKNENWVTKLENCLSNSIINKGINGNTSVDMLVRFNEDVLSYNPYLVFIMGGTNDLLSNRSVSSIIDNIRLMIKDLISINSKIVIGIPPTIIAKDAYNLFYPGDTYFYCEQNLVKLREELINICNNYNITYIDFYNVTLKNLANDIFLDGIHLNNTGQNILFSEAIKNYEFNSLSKK
ncbi:GDSL-type esterase/lipase family protein [Clostridium carnis]